ncbi:MAG: hypothetical protein QOF30_1889 [Acidimicrobiaceae bacterium]|nr:hypothetical protein [Acidimicrobiaceae bacterium]
MLSDQYLIQRLAEAPLLGSGIGGTSTLLAVEGTPVFVKQVPLTDLERRPENHLSTANLFQLPMFYQYGVGSAGFGAWRELAAHSMTTSWVLDQKCESFPLMYHWRVLETPTHQLAGLEEQVDLEAMVAYWNGSTAVRHRLEALTTSAANLVLFLEHLPTNLHEWLTLQRVDSGGATESALAMVEGHLRSDVAFMNSRGLLHFDAHFRNILTDGRQLYFTDFGLATSSQFNLSDAESKFFATNYRHDACYTVTQLVNWLSSALAPHGDRDGFIQRCAEGEDPKRVAEREVATPVAEIITRYAPIAVVINDFYWKLHGESRATPYPFDAIQRVCASAGLGAGMPSRQ